MRDMKRLTPPVEDFQITQAPFYLPVGHEVELFTHAWQAQIPARACQWLQVAMTTPSIESSSRMRRRSEC